MMNVEVMSPAPHAWSSMCRPPNHRFDGSVDQTLLYSWSASSLVENFNWCEFTERELFSRLSEEAQISRNISPPPLSSLQVVGKSLLGRAKFASLGLGKCEESVQWYCDTFQDSSLIPGLPEDVAQQCLALVRREDFPSMRKVCRAWWDLVHTREFYHTRKGVGTLEEWLYVLVVSADQKGTGWEVLNPKQKGDWKAIPRMPGVTKMGSGTVVVNEKLVVIGGAVIDEEASSPSADVYVYDPVLDKYVPMRGLSPFLMHIPR